MLIDRFLAGVLATVLIECILFFTYAVIKMKNKK